jgi:hypothetical protein
MAQLLNGEMDILTRLNLSIRTAIDDQIDEVSALAARIRIEQGEQDRISDETSAAKRAGYGGANSYGSGKGLVGATANEYGGLSTIKLGNIRPFDDSANLYKASASRRNDSYLEQTFGKIEEFHAYKTAFDTLGGAVSASLTAWIDGSESAGKAFKHFVADALKALASQMLIEALKHGAYALGSLAFGDPAGAAKHGAAAAAFGAGAVAAAVAARALGTTAGDANGAKGAGASGGGGGSGGDKPKGSDGGSSRPIVIIATSTLDETDRMRQSRLQKAIDNAMGASS